MAAWEVLAPRRPLSVGRLPRWPSNLGIVVVDALLVRLLVPTAAVGAALYAAGHGIGLFHFSICGSRSRRCSGFLVLDLVIYAQHVVFHHVPWLWRLHRMHHADLDIDVSTGLRFHPFEILISLAIKIAIVLAFGIPPVAVFVFEVVLNATSLFNHSNVSMPPLARPHRAARGGDARHAPRAPFDRARARPTAISASICRGGTGCSAPTAQNPRPATTA